MLFEKERIEKMRWSERRIYLYEFLMANSGIECLEFCHRTWMSVNCRYSGSKHHHLVRANAFLMDCVASKLATTFEPEQEHSFGPRERFFTAVPQEEWPEDQPLPWRPLRKL